MQAIPPQVGIGAPTALLAGLGQVGEHTRQLRVPGIGFTHAMDERGRRGQFAPGQRLLRVLQQVCQRVLATFQRLRVAGLQAEDALVQPQRAGVVAVQMAGRACRDGLKQQPLDAGLGRFTLAQRRRHGVHLRRRHRQFAGKRHGAVRVGVTAFGERAPRLRQRRLADPGQPRTRIGAIRIERERGLVQLARALAVGRRQCALRQRPGGVGAQLLGAGVGPQPLRQGLPQHQQQRRQCHGDHDADPCLPPPLGRADGNNTRAGILAFALVKRGFSTAVEHGFDTRARPAVSGVAIDIGMGGVGLWHCGSSIALRHAFRRQLRCACSTPGKAANFPRRLDNCP